jgi:hypothetical protein
MGIGDTPGGRNVLVVSTVEEIGTALRAELNEDDVVKVVVPVVGQGFLDWLANDEKAFSHAVGVADAMAEELPGTTVDAGAGESDVGLAIRDALATFPADEIVVAVSRDDEEVEDVIAAGSDTPAGARRIEGIPVRFVTIGGR